MPDYPDPFHRRPDPLGRVVALFAMALLLWWLYYYATHCWNVPAAQAPAQCFSR